jgi:hypothetical protein
LSSFPEACQLEGQRGVDIRGTACAIDVYQLFRELESDMKMLSTLIAAMFLAVSFSAFAADAAPAKAAAPAHKAVKKAAKHHSKHVAKKHAAKEKSK